jgi:hypothetical protein
MKRKRNEREPAKLPDVTPPEPPPLPPILDEPPERVLIGIENFDQKSRHVHFTEPATVEALKRLGYVHSEFNYQSLKDFQARSTDPNVIKLLSDRYADKRKSMIDKVKKMRTQILAERDVVKPLPVVLRREQMRIEQTKQTIQQMEHEGESTLKKLTVARLRTIAEHGEKVAKSARTAQRHKLLDELHAEAMQEAKNRKPYPKPAERVVKMLTLEEFQGSMDEHLRRAEEYMRGVREKWERAGALRRQMTASAHARSREQWEEAHARKMRALEQEQQRFAEWKRQHEEAMGQAMEQARARIAGDRNATGTRAERELERRKRILAEMEEKQQKFVRQCERYERELRERWAHKIEVISSRATQARVSREALYQENWEKKKQFVEGNQRAFLERQQALQDSENLQLRTREADRNDRAENARHCLSAAEHMAKLKSRQMKDDMSSAAKLAEEGQRVTGEKTGARLRLAQAKKRLEKELRELRGLDDQAGIARIQKILKVSEAQMAQFLDMAKARTGEVPVQRWAPVDDA